MKKSLKSRTKMVHAGHWRSQFNEVSEAVYLTQSYVYDSAEHAQEVFDGDDEGHFICARYGNPTVAMFQERVAALEGADAAFATASGMAAVSGALLATVKAGDHVVSARALFGSCLYILEEILPRNYVGSLLLTEPIENNGRRRCARIRDWCFLNQFQTRLWK